MRMAVEGEFSEAGRNGKPDARSGLERFFPSFLQSAACAHPDVCAVEREKILSLQNVFGETATR